jgi:trehalose/maltose transport system substrate-binding protein
MWHVIVFALTAVLASRVCASSECTPGVHASVWKTYYQDMAQYIRVHVLQDLMRQQNDPTANFVNLLQPTETKDYFQMAKAMLKDGSLDVFDVDNIYRDQFEDLTADLRLIPGMPELIDSLDPVIRDLYEQGERMIAFPLFKNEGILVYRTDLLRKHGFDDALPTQRNFTWERFQEVAEKIMNEERKNNPNFLGYAWQGHDYEGLTCNLMEWLGSDGFVGSIVDKGKITMNEKDNTRVAKNALERARDWLKPGNISHRQEGTEGPLQWREPGSLEDFLAGNSLFLRIWSSKLQAIEERAATNGLEVDATYLPKGEQVRAATLGAFGVALANMTRGNQKCREKDSIRALRWMINKTAAREYFKYGLSPVYNRAFTKELCANAASDNLFCRLLGRSQEMTRVVKRPSTRKYIEISELIHSFVHEYLGAPEVQTDDLGGDMSNTTMMLKRLSCALNRTLKHSAPTVTPGQCSGEFQSLYERRNAHAKLWPGDNNCNNNFNFISPMARIVCFGFCITVYILCALCAFWIAANKSHIVVNRSQPIFLYMVLFGVALNISTIIPLVMDESLCNQSGSASHSECQDTLDASCRSIPFVYGYGFFITFGSLLVKLWRVEKIFNNKELKRIKITVPQLLGWVGCLVTLVTVVNIYWAFHHRGGLSWYRVIVGTSDTGGTGPFCEVHKEFCEKYYELTRYTSVGYCGGGRTTCSISDTHPLDSLFLAIYALMQLLMLSYAIYIGYKTRDINTSFAEGRYITISIVNQFQLVIVGLVAFGVVSREQYNTNTVVLVSSCILCFGNLSTLVLLFVPKFIAMRKIDQSKTSTKAAKRDDLNSYLLLE